MLLLSRKPGQTVYLGNDVQITVLRVREGRVRIRYEAPTSVGIQRGELYVSDVNAVVSTKVAASTIDTHDPDTTTTKPQYAAGLNPLLLGTSDLTQA